MIYYQNSCMLILFTGDIIDCLTGDILCGDILLAILLTGDIIDWRYFAWRYFAGDILLAIFLPYTNVYSQVSTPENNLFKIY